MLDSEIKRRIDGARNVLVGQIPDPKGQVEQITTALVYRFMDDLDRRAAEAGGKRSFFVGEYAGFAWERLMDTRLGGDERRDLYVQAVEQMAANERLPYIFRAMFKGAFVPFRDGRILTLFLKEIDALPYSHSEDLGTPFEYLLSIMGTQGDAGQFRTPRHIIDFIVAIVDPQKSERIHDPACGTAGFLISAYRHIQEANKKHRPGDSLTQSEKKNLPQNIIGCELDPGMVRLSLVNMYLHRISQPQIREYDTLTYDDLWDESYDVILANPPFMTPKGGILPHSRFAVQAKRSEVLFVDYIAEHLSLRGRAGVIVPEGIIFQSQRAYKELRRRLAEDWGLWAVVSLPAGVFNPYSGVKTSILFLDKTRAKGAEEILFLRVSADGFDLGAQRRTVVENDLPHVRKILSAWKRGEKLEGSEMALWTPKEKIAEDGEYSLSAERYRVAMDYSNAKWPMVKLGEVCEVIAGQSPNGKHYNTSGQGMPFFQGKTEFTEKWLGIPNKWTTQITKIAEVNDIVISVRAPVGPVNIVNQKICIGRGLAAIRASQQLNYQFLFYLLQQMESKIQGNMGATFASINRNDIQQIQILLPPLAVQEEIVAEVDGYQRVIDGARLAIANWKPTININPSWPKVKLGSACQINPRFVGSLDDSTEVPFIPMAAVGAGNGMIDLGINRPYAEVKKGYTPFSAGDVIFAKITPCMENGKVAVVPPLKTEVAFGSTEFHVLRPRDGLDARFLYSIVSHEKFRRNAANNMTGSAGQQRVPLSFLVNCAIPLPPLSEQQRIVAEIGEEEKSIAACRHLIDSHEEKIRAKIAGLWGEEENYPDRKEPKI